MCKYCSGKEFFPTEYNEVDLFIKKNKLKIVYDIGSKWDNLNTSIEIKYCPFCGKKLEEK